MGMVNIKNRDRYHVQMCYIRVCQRKELLLVSNVFWNNID